MCRFTVEEALAVVLGDSDSEISIDESDLSDIDENTDSQEMLSQQEGNIIHNVSVNSNCDHPPGGRMMRTIAHPRAFDPPQEIGQRLYGKRFRNLFRSAAFRSST